MAEQARFTLRVRYGKLGRLRFLSHLEVMRALMRIVRRAELPFAISQGFSPHMKTSFSAALPVGCCGLDEYLDVQLTEFVPPHMALASLQHAAPEALPVWECAYVPRDAPVLSADYPFMSYTALLDATTLAGGKLDGRRALEGVREATDALLRKGEVRVVRKGREKRVSLSKRLVSQPVVRLPACREAHEDVLGPQMPGICLVEASFETFSDNSGSLRADVFLQAIGEQAAGSLPVRWLAHTRTFCRDVVAASGQVLELRPL